MNTDSCSIDGCDREAKVKGLCKKHYHKSWKQANLGVHEVKKIAFVDRSINLYTEQLDHWSFNDVFQDIGGKIIGEY